MNPMKPMKLKQSIHQMKTMKSKPKYRNKHKITNINVSRNTDELPADNIITTDVIDEQTYQHFKSLLPASRNLCKGKTHSNNRYKVHIALKKDFATVKKHNHYRIIYVHNNKEIFAYIAVQLFKRDGGFMFIHKVCSTGGGHGTRLMNIILEDAKQNAEKLGITYLSLTTHNLDLIDYYNQFNPTKTEIIDSPGSKRQIPNKVAYMIWQLSPNMPHFNY